MPDPEIVPVCLKFCAAAPTAGNVLGAPCALDVCDESTILGGAFICPEGSACEPVVDPATGVDHPAVGECVQNGNTFGSPCDPTGDTDGPCETGSCS